MTDVPIVAGMLANVKVAVISVDNTANPPTASIDVIDNNLNVITGPATLPQGILEPIGSALNRGDVMRNLETGMTLVVEWVDPSNPFNFSASASGFDPQFVVGWQKVGTFSE